MNSVLPSLLFELWILCQVAFFKSLPCFAIRNLWPKVIELQQYFKQYNNIFVSNITVFWLVILRFWSLSQRRNSVFKVKRGRHIYFYDIIQSSKGNNRIQYLLVQKLKSFYFFFAGYYLLFCSYLPSLQAKASIAKNELMQITCESNKKEWFFWKQQKQNIYI